MTLFARLREQRVALAVVAALLLCALSLTQLLRKRGVVARLDDGSGRVERDRRATAGAWEGAAPGAEFVFGDGLRTGESSRASVTLLDRSRLALDQNTLVRFLERPSGSKAAKLDVQAGAATLEAVESPSEVDLSLGKVRLESHSKLRLVRDGSSLRLEVVIGSARMLDVKEIIELTVGKAVEIRSDRSLHRVSRASTSSSPSSEDEVRAAPSAVPSSSASGEPAALEVGGRQRGPSVVDFSATAGESFVIHDAKPPTALSLTQSECPGNAVLTLSSSRGGPRETWGDRRVSASVPTGTHRYALACLDERGQPGQPVTRGIITVLADAGTRKLVKTAPDASVETDGRRYTVLYQSLLPRLLVSWPNAPEAPSYRLTVRSSSGTKTVNSKTPRYTFSAGALVEGDHALTFEASGKRSRPTDVVIRFDNAAPTATISSPSDGSFAPGAGVLVSGAALPGWTVSAQGKQFERDDQNRFSAEVMSPSGERALVIRFSHPSRGVHYYLRRSAGR